MIAATSDSAYFPFFEESCFLSQISPKAQFLRAKDHKEAWNLQKRVSDEFNRIMQASNQNITLKRASELANSTLNANDVRMGNQAYFLFGCPKNNQEAIDLFEAAFGQGICIFVTLMQATERPDLFTNFWKQEKLGLCQTKSGWTFKHFDENVIHEHTDTSTRIIQTTIQAYNEVSTTSQTLVHLHLDGWKDQHGIPDEELFIELLNKIDSLQKEKSGPIAVNCFGGIGRTGTTVLSHYLRHHIRHHIQVLKEPPDEILINIPEILCDFRKQRPGFLTVASQLSSVYSVIGVFADTLLHGDIAAIRPFVHKNVSCLPNRLDQLGQGFEHGFRMIRCDLQENFWESNPTDGMQLVYTQDVLYILMNWTEADPKKIDKDIEEISSTLMNGSALDFKAHLPLKCIPADPTVKSQILTLFDEARLYNLRFFITASNDWANLPSVGSGIKASDGWEIIVQKVEKHGTSLIETNYMATNNCGSFVRFTQLHLQHWDESGPIPPDVYSVYQKFEQTVLEKPMVAVICKTTKGSNLIAISHALHRALRQKGITNSTLGQLEALLFNVLLSFRNHAKFIPSVTSMEQIYRLFFAYLSHLLS